MAYATSEDFETYIETFGGTDISSNEDLDTLLERASFDIETATYNRVNSESFSLLSDFQQTMIKNAVCSHAQTLNDYGDMGSILNDKRDISLGDLSVKGSTSDIKSRMSSRTLDFLYRTGLLNRSLERGTGNAFLNYWYNVS